MSPIIPGAPHAIAAALFVFAAASLGVSLTAESLGLPAILRTTLLKPAMSIAVLCASASLWLLATHRLLRIAASLGVLVCVIGLTALGHGLGAWSLDDAWSRGARWMLESGTLAGQVSALTAMCLVGVGLSLWAAGLRESVWRIQILALIVALMAVGALVGYLYGVQELARLGSNTAMLPQSAMALLMLSAGLVFLNPREALIGAFHEDSPGGRQARRLLPAVILTPIAAGWVVLKAQQAGWYDASFGVALAVLITLTLLTAVLWIHARVIGHFDERRRQSDEAAARIAEEIRQREDAAHQEERHRASQRFEALGQLAGSIAHDVNNMMTVVSGYSAVMLQNLEPDHQLRASATEIKKAGDRCIALTRRLLAFSRRQVLTPAVLDLGDMLSDLSGMLPMIVGDHIRVVATAPPGLWRVRADPAQLEQVIVNLSVNARDAMPEGGTLSIETTNLVVSAGSSFDRLGAAHGEYVGMSVTDTGVGMDAATLSQAFDPFFTTKPVGEGTGLGLSTVYGVIRQSGGYVYAESSPGHGTTIRILLPRVLATPVVPAPVPHGPSGTGTILVVEDDQGVREFLAVVLQRAGYRVLVAADGEQALTMIEDGTINLMVSDVVMHGIGGKELAARVRRLRPDTAILLMSGYPRADLALATGEEFLQKPFDPDQLLTKVRQMLDSAKRSAGRAL